MLQPADGGAVVPGRGSQVDNVEYDADSGDLYMGLISRVLDPFGLGGAIVARRAEDYRPSVALLQDTGVACVKPMRMLHSHLGDIPASTGHTTARARGEKGLVAVAPSRDVGGLGEVLPRSA